VTISGSDLRATLFGWSQTSTDPADAYDAYVHPSSYGIADLSALGPYAVAIGGTNGVDRRTFVVDTSFEPYRREAFRHRTLPAQRQSINFTNISGEGTVNTEGLWRREQTDWSMGAGQLLLDQKRDSQETRFRSSFGLDAFTLPYQMTLQHAVKQNYSTTLTNVFTVRCGGYVVVIDGTEINLFSAATGWSASPTVVGLPSGLTSIYSITANDSYVYLGTNNGIWYFQPAASSPALTLYAANDTVGGGTAGSSFTGTTTFTSTTSPSYTITSVSGTPVLNQIVSGVGITPGSVITAINGTTVTLNLPVTASGTTSTFSQTTLPTPTFTGFHLVRWIGNTLFAASGNRLYIFSSVHPIGSAPTIATPSAAYPPDLMMIHDNPKWIWSDATLGASQAYIAGYVWTSTNGTSFNGFHNYNDTAVHRYGGCIYRSDLTQNASVTSFSQPYTLNYPVQALPMSPDEYPTCLYSYLNFIFIGTSKGIRMAQTLSAYDPNQQQAGDLKSGPTIPNILQPVTQPVTAITGDDRFVYFAWANYTDPLTGTTFYQSVNSSTGVITPNYTGIGRLDLSTYIKGDPLAPAYQSDLMAPTTGTINSLDWDPILNVPMFAVAGSGVWSADKTKFVKTGVLNTGYFDYGIPDQKIPVYFDYGVYLSSAATASATLTLDPNDSWQPYPVAIEAYGANDYTLAEKIVSVPQDRDRAAQFEVALTVNSDGSATPTIHRWTLKSWPATVSETQIMVPLQFFSVDSVDGYETGVDPYDAFSFLEQLRENQTITQYQEGPLICNVIVDSIDWIPHKRRGNYENGFEGDCVVTLKTIGGYVPYTPVNTI